MERTVSYTVSYLVVSYSVAHHFSGQLVENALRSSSWFIVGFLEETLILHATGVVGALHYLMLSTVQYIPRIILSVLYVG